MGPHVASLLPPEGALLSLGRPGGKQAGLSLIELVIFIAIVGIAIAGVLVVYDRAVRHSADPMVRKQAIAVAESLLGEVLLQPFTWCDPQDAANDAATPPASSAACTGGATSSQDKGGGALGPQPGTESRGSATDPFDNVADYNGFSMGPGIVTHAGAAVAGLEAYSASVTVTRSGATFGLAADAVLRIDVQVSGRGETITLTGWRFRHSPNATG
ncbi:MAG TPA: prepilin-type N-terminal cleavage/methylation domain-containing protein [Albitalea sp.]|uniref:type IV pilus modification PilV family protein n=1 Tax=Piscinibacter sp. TaxID=1903157 RepID=UPI002ED02611